MPSHKSDYKPISCDFHDQLEAFATTREVVSLRYLDEDGIQRDGKVKILDVYSGDGAEYVNLSTGKNVRLDKVLAVNNRVRRDP